MKRFAIKVFLCGSVCCVSALAVATSHIKDASEGDFAAGTFTDTVVTTEGKLTLARQSQTLLQAEPKVQFVNAVLAVTDPGDEIVLNLPYYFNHEMAVAIADCKAVCVSTDDDYQLRPEAIERAAEGGEG